MIQAFVAVSAVVPSLLLMRYFHVRDRHREPGRVLWATFGWGVLSIFGVVIVLPYSPILDAIANPWIRGTLSAFLEAAIPEEALKLLVLLAYCARHPEFDEPIDGMIYGAAASLGFATLENVLYVAQGGAGVAIMRAFTAVPQHAFTGAILGYYVGVWKFHRQKRAVFEGLFIVIVLHGVYDTPLLIGKAMGENGYVASSGETIAVGILMLVFSLGLVIVDVVWARRLLLRSREEQDGPATRARQRVDLVRAAASTRVGVDFLLLLGGGLLASVGGLIALGLGASAFSGASFDERVLFGGLLLGVPPLVLGTVLFLWGARRHSARADALRAGG